MVNFMVPGPPFRNLVMSWSAPEAPPGWGTRDARSSDPPKPCPWNLINPFSLYRLSRLLCGTCCPIPYTLYCEIAPDFCPPVNRLHAEAHIYDTRPAYNLRHTCVRNSQLFVESVDLLNNIHVCVASLRSSAHVFEEAGCAS